jgi:hypothetical protein
MPSYQIHNQGLEGEIRVTPIVELVIHILLKVELVYHGQRIILTLSALFNAGLQTQEINIPAGRVINLPSQFGISRIATQQGPIVARLSDILGDLDIPIDDTELNEGLPANLENVFNDDDIILQE